MNTMSHEERRRLLVHALVTVPPHLNATTNNDLMNVTIIEGNNTTGELPDLQLNTEKNRRQGKQTIPGFAQKFVHRSTTSTRPTKKVQTRSKYSSYYCHSVSAYSCSPHRHKFSSIKYIQM